MSKRNRNLFKLLKSFIGEHTDDECLDVLSRVRLISDSIPQSQGTSRAPSIQIDAESALSATSSKTPISLDTQVSAGGTNFSQGQRQLIALARALLRRSSIVIADEPTSSLDFDVDRQIQAMIREEFKDSLLLTGSC